MITIDRIAIIKFGLEPMISQETKRGYQRLGWYCTTNRTEVSGNISTTSGNSTSNPACVKVFFPFVPTFYPCVSHPFPASCFSFWQMTWWTEVETFPVHRYEHIMAAYFAATSLLETEGTKTVLCFLQRISYPFVLLCSYIRSPVVLTC